MLPDAYKIGQVLPGGAIVIAYQQLYPRTNHDRRWLLACIIPDNTITPYVTWKADDNPHSTHLGHYHRDLESLATDFRGRLG